MALATKVYEAATASKEASTEDSADSENDKHDNVQEASYEEK